MPAVAEIMIFATRLCGYENMAIDQVHNVSIVFGISIIQRVADRSATVKVLDNPWLDLTTPMGKGILTFLSVLAEDERERLTRRTNEGR